MLVYRFLHLIIPIALRVFYREVSVHGRLNLVNKGPLLVVSNHPNTLLDPVIVATVLRQRAGFIAKGTLFTNKIVAAILRFFHVVPVFRKEDAEKNPTDGDNQLSFQKSYEYLSKGGTIIIFPEGTSYPEMKLRKVKTGAARIGLEFEAQEGFKAGCKILPVSLNYSDPSRFRTRLNINITPAIDLADYADAYAENPAEAVNRLTERIRRRLEGEMVVVEDKEQEIFLKKARSIYARRLLESLPDEPSRRAKFLTTQGIGRAITWLKGYDPERYDSIRKETESLHDLITRLRLKHGFLDSRFARWNPILLVSVLALYLVLLFPIYAWGVLTNFIPYIIPGAVAAKLTRETEYWSSIMVMLGMFLFPIFYAAEIWLFHHFWGHIPWATVAFGLSLPLSGLLALDYWLRLQRFIALVRLHGMGGMRGSVYAGLRERKETLVAKMEALREEFWQATGIGPS